MLCFLLPFPNDDIALSVCRDPVPQLHSLHGTLPLSFHFAHRPLRFNEPLFQALFCKHSTVAGEFVLVKSFA